MTNLDPRRAGVAATFDEVAKSYLDGPARAWEPVAHRLIEVAAPKPGDAVLDVCCGAAAAALRAAEVVGPEGSVLGIDISEEMLALGRRRAREQGLDNIELRTGEMESLALPDESFDVVVCALGIFFAQDKVVAAREQWRVVKPGGRVAMSVWAAEAFEPALGHMWDALLAERRDLQRNPPPYVPIGTPRTLRDLLEVAGMTNIEILAEPRKEQLPTPEDVWSRIMTGGFRAILAEFDDAARERVRLGVVERVRSAGVTAYDTSIMLASATKPT